VPLVGVDGDAGRQLLVGEPPGLDVVRHDAQLLAVVARRRDADVGRPVDDVVAAGQPREGGRAGDPDGRQRPSLQQRVQPGAPPGR
jgi:hypothetical protein